MGETLLAAAAGSSSSSRFAGLCLRTMEGGRESFDNGHIKAALLPEKGDDEAESSFPKSPEFERTE